jgi:hypothetical protein
MDESSVDVSNGDFPPTICQHPAAPSADRIGPYLTNKTTQQGNNPLLPLCLAETRTALLVGIIAA